MKGLSVVAIAISLLLIVLTSPPYPRPEAAGSTHHRVYWVNPDGTRGSVPGAANPAASQSRRYAWINPDGVGGTAQSHLGRLLARRHSWMNPDGSAGTISAVHARPNGPDSAL